jgi:peptidoglycan/xylan/chitin deacetylase (PgdA/CDA1 family)
MRIVRQVGGLSAIGNSRWRSRRLLVLCYHGFSLHDEHIWNPSQYVTAAHFESRLELLEAQGYHILPLSEALTQLAAGELPPRSVAITIDDGTYDFYVVAYPILKHRRVPFTLYVATYYVFDQRPVFDGAASYLLWKAVTNGRGPLVIEDPETAVPTTLSDVAQTAAFAARVRELANRQHWTPDQKHAWLTQVAERLGIDWAGFLRDRLVSLMSPGELRALDPDIANVQLHTHRHRVPEDRELFHREIHDNRQALARCGFDPSRLTHFCYPSGVHRRMFLPWLDEAGITWAVTSTPRLVSRDDDRLLVPRFIDAQYTSQIEFESWAAGFRHIVRRPGRAFKVNP